jgi:cytochrome c biogenesis protein CcdA
VIDHFKTLETEIASLNKNNVAPKETPETTETITETTETTTGEIIETATETTATTTEEEKTTTGNLSFLPTLVVAALADSINPCAFAVMLLLLTSILTKTQNKRKALIAGLLFSLAVFITYFLIGMGVLQLLGTMTSLFRLKRIVGIVGILV